MKIHLAVLLLTAITISASAQTSHTKIFQPGTNASDVILAMMDSTCGSTSSLAHMIDSNFTRYPEMYAMAWTGSGCPMYTRAVMRFDGLNDTTQIPSHWLAHITSASLVLYDVPNSTTGNFGNSFFPGSPYPDTNYCYVYNLANSFDKSALTWRNQPEYKHFDSALIPYTTEHFGSDSVVVNVTSLVQDLFTHNNTGFLIKLKNEFFYQQRLFASCKHSDSTKHPKLKVVYMTVAVPGINDPATTISVYPNPAINELYININGRINGTLAIINQLGQEILTKPVKNATEKLDIRSLPSGIYFIRIQNDAEIITTKFLKK